MRLVRRIRDVVAGAPLEHSGRAFQDAFVSLDLESQREAVADYAYLEPLDSSLAGTCLVTVSVEVVGLKKEHRVWICGGLGELGEWKAGGGVELAYSPQLSLEGGLTHVWSAVLRLPSSQDVAYKYCVARRGVDPADACFELGDDRLLRTPAHSRAAVFDRLHSPLAVLRAREQTPAPAAAQRHLRSSLQPAATLYEAESSRMEAVSAAPAAGLNEADSSRLEAVSAAYEWREATPEWCASLGGNNDDLAYQPLILRTHATARGDGVDTAAGEDMTQVSFEVEVHGAGHGEVFLCGSHEALGGWKQERAVRLFRVAGSTADACGQWRCQVSLPSQEQVKYKYVIKRDGQWRWEPGIDRSLAAQGQGHSTVEDRLEARAWLCAGHTDEEEGMGEGGGGVDGATGGHEPQLAGVALDLVRDVDSFLHGGRDALPFEQQVQRNRLLVQRCHSALEKTVDEYTHEQVVQRVRELEEAYNAAGTVSHQIHLSRSQSQLFDGEGGAQSWQSWPLAVADASSPPLSRVSSPSPGAFAAADDSERPCARKTVRRAGSRQGRGWSSRMRPSPTHWQPAGKKHLAHSHSFDGNKHLAHSHSFSEKPSAGAAAYGGPAIGVVQTVLPDSPAYKAGLQEGDYIIAMGSTDAASVSGDLLAAVAHEVRDKAAAGATMDVRVVRGASSTSAGAYDAAAPRGAHKESTLRLRPGSWHGEGLLGMRIAQLAPRA